METKQKLILASGSPRRAELLQSAGVDFIIQKPETDETPRAGESPSAFAERAAVEKAEWFQIGGDEIVIGADTVVTIDGQILGKPAGAADAVSMLQLLSGRTHEVITGVCLRSAERTVSFAVVTSVEFRVLSAGEIAMYVASGEPMDKAGAYAIQGGAAGMVRRIDGSYSNVVGLPLCETIEELRNF